MVLIGVTGTGKSATGNTLVGGTESKFISSPSRSSVTAECHAVEVERFGRKLVVIDTPGIFDTNVPVVRSKILLMEFTQLASPGVHVFLLVMKIGQKNIADRDQKSFKFMKKLLGEEFRDHTIVVFTGEEILRTVKQDLETYISELPDECRKLVNSCEGGYLAISNTGGIASRERSAKQIIEKANDLVQLNGGFDKYYSNILFDETYEKMNKMMEDTLKQNAKIVEEIKLKQKNKRRIELQFNDGNPSIEQHKLVKIIEKEIEDLRKKLLDRNTVRRKILDKLEEQERKKKVGNASATTAITGTVAVVATAAVVFLFNVMK
ncbi:GTPase IMAP family member 9-like [Ylistrum balloti]|uniref:GTPase IMAP family member 9-like n=1 Tax=Ylistrum balloti TaxID=509963 RepID=UPI002905E051|nr:GTPase IMAP family member 9-like [Ylistrum balloti]